MAGEAALGRAVLELSTDDKKLDAGLADVPKKVQKVGESVKGLAGPLSQVNGLLSSFGIGLSIGAVVSFGKALLDAGDQIVKVSDRTGLAYDEVQRLQFIAEQSGNSIDDLTGAISKLQIRLADGKAKAGIEALGLNFEKIRQMRPADAMAAIASEIGKIENPTLRAQRAVQVFGKSGAEILPTLIANFKELGDAAPVMSDSTVKALDDAGDALAKFGSTIKVWAAESYNFARRLFDDLIALTYRWIASAYQQVSKLVDLAAKLPGASKIGITPALAASLKEDARWFMDASLAMEANTVAATKNKPAVAALPPVHEGASKAAKAHADAIANLTERMSGAGAVKAARDLQEALGKLPPIQNLTKESQIQIAKTMEDAIAVYQAAGKSIPRDLQLIAMAARAASGTVSDAMKAQIEEMQKGWAKIQGIKLGAIPIATGFEDPTWATRQTLKATQSFVGIVSQIDTTKVAAAAAKRMQGAIGPGFWKQAFGSPQEFGAGLSSVIMGAVQGGGNVLNAGGGFIGQKLGTSIAGTLSKSLMKEGAGMFSKALGGMLQSVLPGVGALIGPLAAKLWGALFGTAGRDAKNQMATQIFGSVAEMQKRLVGLGQSEYDRLWKQFSDVGQNNKGQAEKAIADIQAALERQESQANAAADASKRASTEMADAHTAAIEKITEKYAEQFKAIDTEYKTLSDSVAAEAEEAEMGAQETKDRARMAELEKDRAALAQKQQEEIAAEDAHFDALLAAGLDTNNQLRDAYGIPLKIPYEFVGLNSPGLPPAVPMAEGGYGRVTAPTLFYSRGNEDFAFSGEGRGFGLAGLASRPIEITNITNLDGRVVARNQIRHTPTALARVGVRSS